MKSILTERKLLSDAENGIEKEPADPSKPTLASLPVKIEYAEEREKENSLGMKDLQSQSENSSWELVFLFVKLNFKLIFSYLLKLIYWN